MKPWILIHSILLFILPCSKTFSQCPTCTAVTYSVNLSGATDTVWSVSDTRNGNCCTGNNCIKFVVTLNPSSDLLSFDVTSPSPSGSAYYQVNCGPQISIGNPVCINGQSQVCITYCKPGGDSPNYVITATQSVKASDDLSLRQNCTGNMYVVGLISGTVSWTSIFPGFPGQYNSYLSCPSGCASTNVTPTASTPSYIDYRVTGVRLSPCPGINSDTVRVYVVPPLTVSLSPLNPSVCSDGSNSVTLTGTAAGGSPPYTYAWNTGGNTNSITVNSAGVYTLNVSDNTSGCGPVPASVAVSSDITPVTPSITTNSPVCNGTPLNLNASSTAGAIFNWTGPNGFTSTLQNPTITSATASNAGAYSVVASMGSCVSPSASANVVINPAPPTPVVGNNGPLCSGATLNLTAGNIPGATYAWTGPNGFTSSLQNPDITNVQTTHAGVYTVVVTANGCTSTNSTTVVVNQTPIIPLASNNGPLCVGTTLNLSATASAGVTYNWTGPAGFTSNLQNPVITNVQITNAGVYSLTVTANGCTSAACNTNVVVNPLPAAPTAGSNAPICEGSALNLTAGNIPGATYFWTGPGGYASTLQNPSVSNTTVAMSGVYSVTATTNGCTGPAGNVNVIINPIPAAPVISSNSPLCQGTTLNLTANNIAGATYAWTGPNGFSSSQEDPSITNVQSIHAGMYSATVTVAGCTSPASSTNVVVNMIPAAPGAGNNGPVCTGSTLNLTTSTLAGAIYSWTGPNGFSSATEDPSITNVSATNAGSYFVTVTVNGCTSPASTTNVVINAVPVSPTVGSNSPVCSGNAINLTSNTIPGATYSWTGPGGFTSSQEDPTRPNSTTAMSGTYTLTVTVNGCTSAASAVNVVVNTTPAAITATNNGPYCTGATINLEANTITGASYSWTGPAGFTSSLEDPVRPNAIATYAGNYTVTVTLNGCTSAASTTTVVVNPIPSAPVAGSNSPICAGNNINLTAGHIAGATYSWTGPGGFTSALQNPVISNATVALGGTYNVTATVAGCTSNASAVNVVVNPIPAAPTITSNSPVCQGSAISLASNTIAGGTYSWTGPAGFTSSLEDPVRPNALATYAGMYSATVTVSGCTSPAATTNVVVNANPAAPVVSSNTPVCQGGTINLLANNIAGATYAWTGPAGFTSTLEDPSRPNATLSMAGNYTLVVSVNGCPSPAASTSVTVNPTPVAPAVSSNSPVCTGQTINLFAGTIAGATYSWNGPTGFISSLEDPTRPNATIGMAGNYSLTVSVNGCISAPSTTNVVVNTAPASVTANNNGPLCIGAILNLSANNIGGATYTWSGPGGFSSSQEDPVITNVQSTHAGVYSVTATLNGCTSAAATTNVVINPTPPAPIAGSNSPVCTGYAINLTANTIAGATYTWTGPNGFTSALQNPTIANATAAMAGTYTVTATVNGCISTGGSVNVIINPNPAPPFASSNSPVCEGGDLNLFTNNIPGATYSWTGPAGFSSSQEDPAITNVTSANAGTYYLTVTANGCTSGPGSTVVIVNPLPAAPVAGNNGPLCTGQTLNLTAGNIAGATYSWSGPDNFISNAQNPSVSNVTTVAAGIYTVTATVNGCTGSGGSTNVIINVTPIAPTAGSNSPVCVGSTLTLNASTLAGATYSWTGPNGFTSSQQNPLITNVTGAHAGVYSVTVNTGCTSAPATVNVTVNPTPPAPTIVCNSPVCQGSTISFNSSTIPGATYSWTGPAGFTSNLEDPTIPNAQSTNAGIYAVTATVNGCTGPATNIAVSVLPLPVSNAGNDQVVCANNALVSVTATSTTGSGQWTTSGNGTFASPNALSTTYTPGNNDISNGTVTLSFTTANNGVCPSDDDMMVVTITPSPTANAGADQTSCASNPQLSLSGSFTIATGAIWSTSGSGTFTPSATAMNVNYNPSPTDIANGQVTITLTTTGNGNCIAVSDQAIMTILPIPVVDAGPDTNACINNPSISLNGSSTTGAGTWVTNGSGTIANSNSLNTGYTPSIADINSGTTTFILTSANNGSCLPVSDTVVITYIEPPIINAGNNQTVCASNTIVSLNGYSATGSAIWSSSGTGNFTPGATSLNGNYQLSAADIANGSITLTLTSTNNGGCQAVSDQMVITIVPVPTSNAGVDVTVCGNNAEVNLSGAISNAFGAQWSTTGSGSFNPGSTTLNATYTPSAADTADGSVTLYLTTSGNGPCAATSDAMQITITNAPWINAGPDANACVSTSIYLSGISSTGSGVWTTLGDGVFNPSANTDNTNYIAGANDLINQSATIIFTSASNGSCNAVSDTLIINYDNSPVADAGPDLTGCAYNSIALNGTVSSGTAEWSTVNGAGTFSSTTNLSTTYVPVHADTLNSPVIIILTTTNTGDCPQHTDTLYLTVTPGIELFAGADQFVCSDVNAVALSGTMNNGNGVSWSSSGTGIFSPDNISLITDYIPSASDLATGSVTLYLNANASNCNPFIDSLTVTFVPAPLVDAGPSIYVCQGVMSVQLDGSISSASNTVIWTTSGSGSFAPSNTDTSAVYQFSAADTTNGAVTLYLTSMDNGVCAAQTDSMLITITTTPKVSVGNDTVVCGNGYVNLNGIVLGGNGTGVWTSTGDGTFTPDSTSLNGNYIPGPNDLINGSTTLTLTATYACMQSTDSFIVNYLPAPQASAGNNLIICTGDSVSLNGTIMNAAGGAWLTSGDGIFVPGNQVLNTTYVPGISDVESGEIEIMLVTTGNAGCIRDTSIISVTIESIPVANFVYGQICENANVIFNDTSVIQNGSITTWNWTINGDTTSAENPAYIFNADGMFNVQLIVSTAGGCADTTQCVVNVLPVPTLAYNFIGCADSASFTATADMNVTSWTWNCSDNSILTGPNPSHIFASDGIFNVTLSVTTDSGCVANYSDTIEVEPCGDAVIFGPVAPEAFTPDGDGNNDVFLIRGGPFREYELRIFNEWGNEIFLSTEQNFGWDGTYKNIKQPLGPYVWTYRIVTLDNMEFRERGEVTILK